MPTAAKLTGFVLFALIGAAVALRLPAYLPEGLRTALLLPVTVVVTGLLGWRVAGRRSGGQSYADAAQTGLVTIALGVLSLLTIFATMEMLRLTQRMVYKDPMAAILGIFEQVLKLAPLLVKADLLVVMGVGGILAGLACEAAGRRWR